MKTKTNETMKTKASIQAASLYPTTAPLAPTTTTTTTAVFTATVVLWSSLWSSLLPVAAAKTALRTHTAAVPIGSSAHFACSSERPAIWIKTEGMVMEKEPACNKGGLWGRA